MTTISDNELELDSLRVVVDLPSTTAAAPLARRAARAAMRDWGSERVDDVELVCSELVTNAILHTDSQPTLILSRIGEGVQVEVHDAARAAPIDKSSREPVGGLGLRVVSVLSDAWGWEPTGSGKVVWALFSQHAN